MSDNRRYFLDNKFHYYLVLAVIFTTLISILNLNSYLIILLVVCRLIDGGARQAIRTAVTNIFFWVFAGIFLIEFAGLIYTHDFYAGWHLMERKATLIAIPFVILAGPFTDQQGYRKLFTAYCWLLLAVCVYCLITASVEYRWTQDTGAFFYHSLTSGVGVNAVFFSGYVFVAMLFLLFSSRADRRTRVTLLLFFTIFLILLSSRLVLFLLFVTFAIYFFRLLKIRPVVAYSLVALLTLGLATFAFTDNPFSRRYNDLTPDRVAGSLQRQPISDATANSISLRFFMWRSAIKILREKHAWLIGVSGGDSQTLLDQKYLDAGLYQGYLGYNFHNEYVEVLVRSGIVGLTLFLLGLAGLVTMTRIAGTIPAMLTTVLILLLCATESALEMQHGLFLSCFFPLLNFAGRSPKRTSTAFFPVPTN